MRGITRNIALLLVLAATLVASSAEARVGGGGGAGAAAARMTKGAQVRLNRMKQKMSLRPRGMMQQKTRRQLRLSKKKMMRAMSRRQIGLGGSESERARSAFARDGIGERGHLGRRNATSQAAGFAVDDVTPDHMQESSGAKQGKKMRDRARRRAISEHRKKRR